GSTAAATSARDERKQAQIETQNANYPAQQFLRPEIPRCLILQECVMGPLIAVIGDASPERTFDPPMQDPATAKKAAEELGRTLAERGARLLVYGGPFIESDFVRGFVAGRPDRDRSILMWYSREFAPMPFPEETTQPKLFDRRQERGADWEVAFYRSISRADGIILIGGGNTAKICGQ